MKLKTTQWIAVSATILLVVVIYLFADTKKPPLTKSPEGSSHNTPKQEAETSKFDWEGYLKKVKANITGQDTLGLIANWEKSPSEANFRSLMNLYHTRGESVAEAYYTLQLGLQRKDSLLVRAGDLYAATSAISNDEDMHHYLIDQSVVSYKSAVEYDSSVANRIKLANAYMEQGTAPMQGVGILLNIVAKDPDNVDALLLLGQFGIVSRQYDKAIVRLEKVVSLRPQNYDAIYLLAVAYGNKGDKNKAIELLDKCTKMVDKPDRKKIIEDYKNSLLKGQ